MKKIAALVLLSGFILSISGLEQVRAEPAGTKMELMGKKKKFKGYKKPRSKKILGIFKRKSDCGCPNH
ncbi:hypothetical protein [Dyadobacter sandarakinus]|uniref:Uncharacterized protein n=1 Tax=Dyadobacter sandarakinus TaxID=2747268 RepID=A0ABX7IBR6_9BACT|nr:hypothetical protein [Dyadobacter sandarakinus]QRR02583.1 hypothetical protein HWI92_17540 [Dyadobacter sandarakinus]